MPALFDGIGILPVVRWARSKELTGTADLHLDEL